MMRAALYEEFTGPVHVQRVADPQPTRRGVIIQVGATGLCRSDWHGWMGHDPDISLPHVPGHELAGTVVDVGAGVVNWEVGDRVTLPFVCGCGTCPQCVSGNQQVCDRQFQPGFTGWGSFAEYVAIDYADANLVRLPGEMDFSMAASLGCRFATAFRAIVAQGRVTGGDWVAIHGCGGVGLSAVMIASALGANVVAVDIAAEKLEFARTLGAVATVNAGEVGDVVAAVRENCGGGAHVSMDALGGPITCFNSIASLRKRGTHLQVGLMVADHRHPAVPMDLVIANELAILGCHGMQAHEYRGMLDMIRYGRLQPQKLIAKTVDLETGAQELTEMGNFHGIGVTVIDRFQEALPSR
jgi:alcohol dehydrogenase